MAPRIVTAVALYGAKTGPLKRLLERVQAILTDKLGGGFRPYALDQIHGTVIRLDGGRDAQTGLIVNQRYAELTGTAAAMDHARAWEILAAHLTPPLTICLGGWIPGTAPPFSSRGQHPYQRMFSVQGDAFVLVGWPVSTVVDGRVLNPLDGLRRQMSAANILHWYHRSPADVDNDFHLVAGHHDVPQDRAAEAADAVRAYLACHPVEIEVGVDQVVIVAASSPTLSPAQFIGRLPVSPADIAGLYR